MKTDVIAITANGTGFENVLEETERAAAYRGLAPKQALRLRLLAEEMTGMLRTLIGDEPFRYWVESEGTAFSLHLETQTIVTRELRKALLKTSHQKVVNFRGASNGLHDIHPVERHQQEAL